MCIVCILRVNELKRMNDETRDPTASQRAKIPIQIIRYLLFQCYIIPTVHSSSYHEVAASNPVDNKLAFRITVLANIQR